MSQKSLISRFLKKPYISAVEYKLFIINILQCLMHKSIEI